MQPINIRDYETLAQATLSPMIWDFFAGGSEDETTLRANVSAWQRVHLRPRVLANASHCDLSTTLLGTPVPTPLLIAPMGVQGLAHEEAECATARAAGSAQVPMVVSMMANHSLEEIASVTTAPLWFQFYVLRNHAMTERLLRRAEMAGYRALVLTVDTPTVGRRERDQRNGFHLPPHLTLANLVEDEQSATGLNRNASSEGSNSVLTRFTAAMYDDTVTWQSLAWLRSVTQLPLILKGIMHPDDARLALEHGAAAIIVSNHGGRQLDGAAATLDVLPEIVEAVAGRCEVYVDGGIRRGVDILKALALGARAVLVGRPVLWGLAVDGEAGVAQVLELLQTELVMAMRLAGCSTVAGVDRSLLLHQR